MSRPTANQSIIAFFVGLRAICVQNVCEKDVRSHLENFRSLGSLNYFRLSDNPGVARQ